MIRTTKLVQGVFCFTWLASLSGCAIDLSRTSEPVIADNGAVRARVESRTTPVTPGSRAERPTPRTTQVVSPPPASISLKAPDLWRELAREFTFHGLDLPRVRQEIEWYRKQGKFLRETSVRAAPYLHHIVETLRARGLPPDLALLPILESGYNPRVESPYGAAGLWQFMSGTGTRFGLSRTEWKDERLDFVRSTDAALTYLATLATRFDGDWLMAVAAYNAGWGNVESAIQRNRRAGRPTDIWSLQLKGETHRLVARLLALIEIHRDPDSYGLRLQDIPARPYFATLTLDRPTDLRQLAERASIDATVFAALNPGYRRGHTGPGGGHHVRVPVAQLAAARLVAASMEPSLPAASVAANTSTPHGHEPGHESSSEYRVRPGDSLWLIARRFDTRVAALEALNNIRRTQGLKPGQRLRVPSSVRQDARAAIASRIPQDAASDASAMVRYRVRAGDSLWTIARRFGVSILQLRNWNRLAERATLKPGQELLVYLPA